MNTHPLISVITVVRNGEQTLEQTMLSVLNQTYSRIEYILVDGTSTDGTIDIIRNYELKIKNGEFPNVLFHWISEPDKGIYDAMNKGIDMATGEWIGIINSGDNYLPFILEEVSKAIQIYPEADLFFGNMKIINNGVYLRDELFKGEIRIKDMNICHPTVFVNRSIYLNYGSFDTKFPIGADFDLLLRFYINNVKFQHLNIFIASFSTGGVSSGFSFKIVKERYAIRKKNDINSVSIKDFLVYIKSRLKKNTNW